jgi:hypothetical protein
VVDTRVGLTPEEQAIRDKAEALRAAERERPVHPSEGGAERWLRTLGCLGAVLLPVVGVIVGLGIAAATAPKPDPSAMLDFSGIDRAFYGGVIGFFSGLVVGLVAAWLLRAD